MKKSIICAVVCGMVAVGLSACGGGGGGNSSNNIENTNSLAMKGTSGNAVNMNGTWTLCERNNDDQIDELVKATANGADVTINSSIWSAPTTNHCQQTITPDATITETMTITLGAEATAAWTNGSGSTLPPVGVPANAKATKTTNVIKSATLTMNSTSWVTAYNNQAICGKTNWAVGVTVDVFNCPDLIDSKTQTDYWVVDDSSAQLMLYQQNIGTTAYQVDSINPFLK